MKLKGLIYKTVTLSLLFIAINVNSQVNLQQNFSLTNLKLKSTSASHKLPELSRKTSTVLPISIGVLTAIYLLNPMVEYTDRKVYAGLTKEISVGFGKLGEHRTALDITSGFLTSMIYCLLRV